MTGKQPLFDPEAARIMPPKARRKSLDERLAKEAAAPK